MAELPTSLRGEEQEHQPSPFDLIRARTPARVMAGRAGSGYLTRDLLELRQDHAAALDAVRSELELARDLGPELIERFGLFEVSTEAHSKREFLMRPDLGRSLDRSAIADLESRCPRRVMLQVAIGDGLSAAAVAAQVPALLPLLESGARARGWTFGRPFVVRYCRVGVLNAIGDQLDPDVAVLLIGERPGLSTSVSLSAYLAHQPRAGHTDAQRCLVSNIHAQGLGPEEAARRIFELATPMLLHRVERGIPFDSPPALGLDQPG